MNIVEVLGMASDVAQIHQKYPGMGGTFHNCRHCNLCGSYHVDSAMILAKELVLPESVRMLGVKVVLAYSLPENLNASTPNWCREQEVVSMVQRLSSMKGLRPSADFWSNSDTVILFALYIAYARAMHDGVHGFRDHIDHLREHVGWIENHPSFNGLMIVELVESLCNNIRTR